MKKRVLAALLAGMMSLSLVAGCGSTQETGGEASSSAGTEAGSAAEAVLEEASAETAAESAPAAENEETVTVKWLVPADSQKDLDMVMEDLNKKLVEKINVKLELETILQSEYADKVQLASSSGEDFDLMFTSNWLNPFTSNVSRGALLPIDDLLNEYGQDIIASMPDWLLDVGKVDGVLYAVPNQQIIATQLAVNVQKEYADKYGLDATSFSDISELYPFLDQIVANEPDMFPIDNRQAVDTKTKYEAIVTDAVYIEIGDESATLVPATVAQEGQWRQDNEWYQKGYIRKDEATITDNSADVKANRYVCSISTYKPGGVAEYSATQGKEWLMIPIEGSYITATGGIETMTAINVNSKNPEAAMKLLNLVYTDKEIFNELLFGLEGVHYNKTGDDSIELVEDSGYCLGTQAWKLGNQFNAWYMPGQEEGTWEATDELNRSSEISPIRGFTFNPENVQAEIAQINAVVAEFKNGQYTTDDIDQYIADRNAKLEEAGLQTVMDECQRQLDEWKAAQ